MGLLQKQWFDETRSSTNPFNYRVKIGVLSVNSLALLFYTIAKHVKAPSIISNLTKSKSFTYEPNHVFML